MMTQEEIDAILGEDTKSSIVVEDPPTEEDKDISIEGDVFDIIKTPANALSYLKKKHLCPELIQEYVSAPAGSYSAKLTSYRIVVAALTSNEERHLATGGRWYPLIQFCIPGKEKNCWGSKIIGQIEADGKTYNVVGGGASYGGAAGLGGFHSCYGVSYSHADVGFRSVSSERVAKYLSEQFGRLLFEIHYGGTNCNWKWLS